MNKIQVFVSFDIEHDADLHELLVAQSKTPSFGFTVSGSSERSQATDAWMARVRNRIGHVDQMIVICGAHTESSVTMSAELRLAQEEGIPYILLWGRREIMCTKPIGAKRTEGMYSWTQQILQDQITLAFRKADADVTAKAVRNPARKI